MCVMEKQRNQTGRKWWSNLVVGGVQQSVQVLQRRRGLVLEAGQQSALDGPELDSSFRQQVLVLLSAGSQLHTHTRVVGRHIRGSACLSSFSRLLPGSGGPQTGSNLAAGEAR